MVVLLICSPFSQASRLCTLLEIFRSASRPNQCKRYCWGIYSGGDGLGDLGMETVFDIQSILGFHLHNQGIPRMTCCLPKLRTMRSAFSLEWKKRISMWAFHPMVPLILAVPSTLYARMGLGRWCKGKFALDKRLMSMKFLVAPQSMRAVVLTIWIPAASLIGRRIVHSLGRATSTWERSWEEDVEVTFHIKNPHCQRRWWQQLHFLHHLHSKSSGFEEYLQWSYLWWWGSGCRHQWGWWEQGWQWWVWRKRKFQCFSLVGGDFSPWVFLMSERINIHLCYITFCDIWSKVLS